MKRLFTIVLSFLLMASFAKAQNSAPTSFTTEGEDGQVKLTWNKVEGATGYELSRDGQVLQTVTNANDTVYYDRGPVAGSVHFYCVRAMQGGTPSPYINCTYDSSATNAFIASDSTSDGFIQLSWSLPSNCLEAAGDEDIYMEVWDSTAAEEFHSSIFDTSALPNGQDTSQFTLLSGGDHIELLSGSSATAPNLVNRFGYSVAVDGNRAIVGSTTQDNGIGAAYIFEYNGSQWVEQAKLTPSDGAVGDRFGFDVDVDGDNAVVSSKTDTGKAYAFHYNGSNWVQQDILMSNYPDSVSRFGQSVAIKGDQIYVGAPRKYMDLGVVYSFRKNGSNWSQYNMIAASSLQFGQRFGYDISFNGNYAFIGAPEDGGTGRVYVLKGQGAGWSHEANFAPANLQTGDRFGAEVSLYGSEAAVGAPQRSSATGEVYFYEFNGSNWQANGSVVPASATAGSEFGSQMSINSGRLAVGEPTYNSATGRVHLYEELGGTWNYDQQLTDTAIGAQAEYGKAVALNNSGELLVGSPGDDNDRGSLFAYEKNGSWTQTQFIQSGNVSPMTVELWVYVNDRASTNPIFADNSVALQLNTATDNRVNVQYPSVAPKYFDYVVPLQTWTHLSYVVDATNNKTMLYANGRLVAELPEALPVGRMRMGTFNGQNLNARVDNIRLWNDVRSATEIEGNFDGTVASGASGLIEAWRAEGNPPGLVTVNGSPVNTTITNGGTTEEYYPHLFTGSKKHWTGPYEQRTYSLSFHTYGPGIQLCNRLNDDGATLPFQDPIVSSNSNLPDTTVVEWVNNSDAISYFRVFRDTVLVGVIDSNGNQIKDGFTFTDPNTMDNGVTYNYCVEPYSGRFEKTFPQTCTNGSTYDIDLQASNNAHPAKVELTWNSLENWAHELHLLRDGSVIAELDSNKTSYTDHDPIPGRDHGYSLRMMQNGVINATNQDTGSVEAVGVLAGNVLTNEGKYHNQGIAITATAVVLGDTLTYHDTTGIAGDFRIENVFFNTEAEYTMEASHPSLVINNNPLTRTLSPGNVAAHHIYFFSSEIRNVADVPDLITGFDASVISGEDKMELNWSYSQEDTTWFVLYRDDDIIEVLTDTNQTKVTTYVDDNITPGDTHSYDIIGYYRQNDTTYTQDSTTEDALENLTPVSSLTANANATAGNVGLQWNHTSTNINGFYLYRNSTLIDSVSIDSSFTYTDWDGLPGQNITYGIRAYLKKDNNTYTSPLTTASPVTFPALPAPSNVAATQAVDQVEITWEYNDMANSNFDGFLVVRNSGSASDTIAMVYYEFTESIISGTRNYSFTDYKGIPDENYDYEVISYKAAPRFLSAPGSDNVDFPRVEVPTSFQASTGTVVGTNELTWTHSSPNFDGFRIRVGSMTYFWADIHDRSFIHTLLTSNSPSSQSYQLEAYREVEGTKYYSNHLSASATPAAMNDDGLQEPKKFVASDIYPNQVQLKWEYPPYIFAKFRIYRDSQLIDSVDFNTRFYYDIDVSPDSQYVYQVEAVHMGDVSPKATDVGSLKSIVSVSGEVFGQDSMGIPEVRITVENGSERLATTYTDSSGSYSITGLPDDNGATYDVEASKINTDLKQPLKQITIDSQRFYQVDFVDKGFWNPYSDPGTDSVATPIFVNAWVDSFNQEVHIQWLVDNDNYDGFTVMQNFSELATVERGEKAEVIDNEVEGGYTYQYLVAAFWETPQGTQTSELVPVEVYVPKLSPVEGYEAVVDAFSDEVQLYWSHPTNNVTFYEITRNGESIALIGPDETLSFIDSTGLPNRLYNYSITAVNIGSNGEIRSPTKTRQVTFPSVAPITELQATPEPDSNYVELEWAHTSDHYSYAYVYRNGRVIDTLEKADNKVFFDTRGRTDSLTEWAVSAVTVKDETRYESDTTTIEDVYPVLHEPAIDSAVEVNNTLEIHLSYPPKYGFSGYRVYRDTSLKATILDSTGTYTYVDDDGKAEQNYSYSVQAIKRFGPGDYDTSASVGFDSTFPQLAPPQNVQASDGDFYNYVEVKWSYPDISPDGFTIYRRAPDSTFDSIGVVGAQTREFIDQFGINNSSEAPEEFIYAVQAFQETKESDTSATDIGYAQINRLQTVGVLNTDGTYYDNFGTDISTDGNVVTMGSNGNRVNLFEQDVDGNYTPSDNDSLIVASDTSLGTNEGFGKSVTVSGNRMVIGAPDANNDNSGAIYLFSRSKQGDPWELEEIYDNPIEPASQYGTLQLSNETNTLPVTSVDLFTLDNFIDEQGVAYFGHNIRIDSITISNLYVEVSDGDDPGFMLNLNDINLIKRALKDFGNTPENSNDEFDNVTFDPNETNWIPITDDTSNYTISGTFRSYFLSPTMIDDYFYGADASYVSAMVEFWAYRVPGTSNYDELEYDLDELNIHYSYELYNNPANSLLGSSIAYSDGKIFAGAPGYNVSGGYGSFDDGATYLFQASAGFDDTSFVDQEVGRNIRYGEAVDIDENNVIVGAPALDNNKGGAYVLSVSSANNISDDSESLNNLAPTISDNSYFGNSVAISGNFALVGAPGVESDRGAVYLYRSTDNGWELQGEFAPQELSSGDEFGTDVSITGQYFAVGAPGEGDGRGKVYLYQLTNNGNWIFDRSYESPDRDIWYNQYTTERFGGSVSLGGSVLAVGAPNKYFETGGGYIFRLDAAPQNVIATDGKFEGKTRVTWDFEGALTNVEKFELYRDTVYIGDVDPNKNIFFDETGVPGKQYVYNVSAIFSSGSNSIKVGDVGHSKPDGVIDGKVITQQGAVGVKDVAVEATANVEGVNHTHRDTTDANGRYKMKRVYYSDSANYTIEVSRPGHEFEPEMQTTELNVNQPEAQVDPFLDLTAFVVRGKLVKFGTNCGVDSVRVNMQMMQNDSLVDTRFVEADKNGRFSQAIKPYDNNITHYNFFPENQRIITRDGTTDTLEFDFAPDTQRVDQVPEPDRVQEIPPFEDQIAYPVKMGVRNVCSDMDEDWKIQVTSKNGCVSKIIPTGGDAFITDTLPPYEYTVRVIGVGNATEDLIPVVDYLKVRPLMLDLYSFYRKNGRDKTDTLFELPFTFHKTPSISLTGVPIDSFLCGDPEQAMIATQGLQKEVQFEVSEAFEGQTCHVNEGYLIIRNEASTSAVDTVRYDQQAGEFPPYRFTVGPPNLVDPFTKPMIVEYHTEKDGMLSEFIKPVLIKGVAMLPGADVYVEPNKNEDGSDILMPLFNLYDPPGDGSFSYIEKGTSIEKNVNLYFNNDYTVFLGHEQEVEGAGIQVNFELKQEFSTGYGFSRGYTLSATTTERMQTSAESGGDNTQNDSAFVGDMQDVIVGLGIAIKYGVGYQVYLDGCEPQQRQLITTQGDINTTWNYTVDQIRSLREEFTKKAEMARNQQLQLDDRSYEETARFYENMKLNWDRILHYHFYSNVPYINMCNYSFRDLPEPYQEEAEAHLKSDFCNKIGSYSGDKFIPDDNIQWNNDKLDGYNNMRGYVEEIYNNYIEYNQLDSTNLTEFIPDDIGALYRPEAENITFSGGTSYEKEYQSDVTMYTSVDQYFESNTSAKLSVGADVNLKMVTIAGAIAAYSGVAQDMLEAKALIKGGFSVNIDFGRNDFISNTDHLTTGYHLTDDDPGDQYSVNIFKGVTKTVTPYFDLFGGRTSCPAEPGAIYRDQPNLDVRYPNGQAVNKTILNAHPDKPVEVPLQIASLNPFNESRWYELYLVENSNPKGLYLKVDGRTLSTTANEEYLLQPNDPVYATLVMNRNQFYYQYDSIQIGLRSKCDPYVNDIVTLTVHYRHPCSEISIIQPGDNWTINSDTSDLAIRLSDYDPYNQVLKRVQVVQRRLGQNDWDTIRGLSPQYLQNYFQEYKTVYDVPTFPFVWDVTENDLPDGEYEIMAIANCGTGGIIESNRVRGTIDRNSFQMFGKPEPADGVLSIGDEISVTYNKEIDCPYAMSDGVWTFRRDSVDGTEVGATASCSGSKLLFELDSIQKLEGRTIYAHVDSVQDKSYNLQKEPVDWSFKISNNPVYWSPQQLVVTVERGKSKSASVMLESQSSVNRDYTLMNDELWLTYADAAGIIQPNGKSLDLHFDAENMALGTYHDTIVANITDFTKIHLPVSMQVIAPEPNWTVDESNYDQNLSIIANINVDSSGENTDTTNMISAWIDGELRAVGHVRSVGSNYHAAYLSVQGNASDSGKTIRFRAWLADSGKIYKAHPEQEMTYQPGGLVYGTTPDPRILRIDTETDEMDMIPLNEGWTWFSLNRNMGDMSTDAVLSSITPNNGDVIMMGDTSISAEYQDMANGWIDDGLDSLTPVDGYMIHLKEADTLWIWGELPDNPTYVVQQGWNLIGNPREDTTAINDAFFAVSPEFSENDLIKSQSEFAEYTDEDRWDGSLEILYPNEAYKVRYGKTGGGIIYRGKGPATWKADPHGFEHTTRIVGVIQVDGSEFQDNQSKVGAFIDGECRGSGQLRFVPEMDRHMLTLMVYGDEPGEEVSFKIYDGVADTTFKVEKAMAFGAGKLEGTYSRPYVFSPEATTGIDQLSADGTKPTFEISPNPFTTELRVTFDEEQASSYVVEVYNGVGETFFQRSLASVKGANQWVIKPGQRLASGMYYVTIKQDGDILRTFKVVKE